MVKQILTQLLVEYNDVFHEKPEPLAKYLFGISRSKLLTSMTFLLGFAQRRSRFENHIDLLSVFFCDENKVIFDYVNAELNQLAERFDGPIRIVNPIAALQLFEYAFDNLDSNETQTKAEIEINIFKAILAQNEYNNYHQDIAWDTTKDIAMPDRIYLGEFAQALSYSELVNYNRVEILPCQISSLLSYLNF